VEEYAGPGGNSSTYKNDEDGVQNITVCFKRKCAKIGAPFYADTWENVLFLVALS
jgi:hypothetical protein